MANRAKREEDRMTARIPIQVTPAFKMALEEMAQATGVSNSDRARRCLERDLEEWQKSRKRAGAKA